MMETTKTKRGEAAARIYKLLHRNPDLTTNEIAAQLPDISPSMVQVTVSRMSKQGRLESRGRKLEVGPNGRNNSHKTYHVKYGSRPVVEKPKPKVRRTPIVEAPKVVDTQPTWAPPVAEREVLALRHLADIYKAMSLMTEQQDALIGVLKGTLADLAETKEALDQERQRRNWWDKLKDLFS
jgi:hypothetical protein